MFLFRAHPRSFLGLAAVAVLAASCSSTTQDHCQSDDDCKGARICQNKVCVDPTPGTGGTVGTGGAGPNGCFSIEGNVACVQTDPSGPAPDMPASAPMTGTLPASASLDMTGFQAADQGGCGACSVFALRDAMGARAIAQTGTFTDFSAADLAYIAHFTDATCGFGTFIQNIYTRDNNAATDVVNSLAWPWPYNPALPVGSLAKVPAPSVLAQGIAYMSAESGIAPGPLGLDDMKNAIANGWPPAITVTFFNSSGWKFSDGIVDLPSDPKEVSTSSHSIMAYSYDDATQTFGFVNSWGKSFGPNKDGRGTLTYRFLQQYLRTGIALKSITYQNSSGPTCGNGVLDPGEACDGTSLGGATCQSQGFDHGTMSCAASCTLDTSGCCHNGCTTAGATQCSGSTAQTCVTGPQGCLAWGSDTTCPSGCDPSTGHCAGPNPCQGVVCNNPPSSQCYNATGTCSGGTCSYTPSPAGTACNDGNPSTSNDQCNGSGTCSGTCSPSCTGLCGGAPDGCGGTCNGACAGGTTCVGTTCQACGGQGEACCSGSCNSPYQCNGSTCGCGTGNNGQFMVTSNVYPSFGPPGCSGDGTLMLKAAAAMVTPTTLRVYVRKADNSAFTTGGTLSLYVGSGPTCPNPANVVKATKAVVNGQVEQTIDLTVNPYGASWNLNEVKTFWVGKDEGGYQSWRATGTINVDRICM